MAIKIRPFVLVFPVTVALGAPAVHADTIKIAFIDPLSGAFAPVGNNLIHSYQYIADIAKKEKWANGYTFEIVGFDNKASPQESLTQLQAAIDQGYRYVTQGAGSGAAQAIVEAINKHNSRNPGREVLYINHSAIDPDLTNSKCSFWHFRLDANTDMKMEALTSYMAKDQNIKKVYIIGQDFRGGHQFTRAAKEYLKRKRRDIQIVGDDLHPIATVKDFSPYVAKIKASGADTILTGNWGNDLALLIKAAKDAGLNASFYTYYAATTGVPTAMGAAGADRVRYVGYWIVNNEEFVDKEFIKGFKKKYNDDYIAMSTYTGIAMLAKAFNEARSTDPVKVAFALEGMKVKSLNGEVEMRKTDHQLQQPLYIATWTKVNGKDVKYDQENTGYGWKTDEKLDTYVSSQPTSCQMKRPANKAQQ